MVARGHQIDWVMRRGPTALSLPANVEWLGCKVVLSPGRGSTGMRSRIGNLLGELWGDLRILAIAASGRYDVLQVRDRFFVAPWVWLCARLTGARFTFWMSYPFGESKIDQAKSGFARRPRLAYWHGRVICHVLYRWVMPLADHVFVQSDQMLEDVAGKGIDRSKLSAVPMGIRSEQVGAAGDAKAPDPERPLLLHLGVIMRLRQSEILVRVLQRVRARYPGARLRYVGEGQTPKDRRAVEQEAERLGLTDAVEITGFLPMEEAWRHVEEADICFSPFFPIPVLMSTSPTKLVEYLAMAKCVVASEHPEQRKVMEGSEAGELVAWSEEAFADGVFRLLDDPARAKARASRGPEYVARCRTYDVIGREVERAYLSMLGLTG
jgi:glycosyltransferase involved in cell wall biosynthesis